MKNIINIFIASIFILFGSMSYAQSPAAFVACTMASVQTENFSQYAQGKSIDYISLAFATQTFLNNTHPNQRQMLLDISEIYMVSSFYNIDTGANVKDTCMKEVANPELLQVRIIRMVKSIKSDPRGVNNIDKAMAAYKSNVSNAFSKAGL